MKTKFELLSNFDLENYCRMLSIPLNDVLSKDLFKNVNPKVGCYIINLQSSTIGLGTHWCALLITTTYAIYYDSFGGYIPTSILKFVRRFNKTIKIIYSIDQIQEKHSLFCGWFCLYFLWFYTILHHKCTNYKYLLNKHNSIFSLSNRHLNDRILRVLISNIVK